MKIRIPRLVVRAWDITGDWSNVAIWNRGRLEVRRLDVLLVLGGLSCVGYYWLASGWQGALAGGAMYVLVAMMALWML